MGFFQFARPEGLLMEGLLQIYNGENLIHPLFYQQAFYLRERIIYPFTLPIDSPHVGHPSPG